MSKIKLIPVAMRKPSSEFIEAPSKISKIIEVSQKEFDNTYAGTERSSLVSFEDDGISNPKPVTTFGRFTHYIKGK
jgi:hypothetical protein